MGRKDKPRMIPEQDKRICGSICFCTLTVVLSGVSIVYLSVAIYSPSYKAFRSGFELEPVMCQTIDLNMTNNCRWASCGEWCLTKTSGFCPQIKSTVRRNGTEIQLNNCTKVTNILCPQIDPGKLKKYNCNNGSLCSVLHGVFNCSMGHCKNMSEFYQCHHKPDGPTLDPEQDNTKLNGFFYCFGPKCTKIKKPFTCDRFCPKITTFDVNVLIMQDNSLFTANCYNGLALTESHGKDPGEKISPTEFWNDTGGIMLTNCMSVTKDGHKLRATDCLNGTLLDHDSLPHAFMNFTQFWKIYQNSNRLLDPSQRFLPKQSNITIYDSSRLFINLEGCVNTLRGECVDFVYDYGNDGDNDTAQSRYLCYYNKNNQDFVIARFDLAKTWKELLIALIIPIVLFVISSVVLFILTKSVRVGDDTKMRCKYCVDGNNSDMDDSYVVKTNPRSIKRYRVEAEPTPVSEINEQIRELNMLESHEAVGSTKSLIPLSPCEDTTTDKIMSTDNNPTELTEKPLVIL